MGLKYTNISWKKDKKNLLTEIMAMVSNPDTEHSYERTPSQSDKKNQPLRDPFYQRKLSQQSLSYVMPQCAKLISIKNII